MKRVCGLTSLWRSIPKTQVKDWNRSVPYCGEDALIVHSRAGKHYNFIADGVGGWRESGVDPSEFAWGIMSECKEQVEQFGQTSPLEILKNGYSRLKELGYVKAGSSTVSLVAVELGKAHICNLGDSGFRLFRDSKLAYKTVEQQYFFNAPYQLSILPEKEKREGSLQTQPEAAFCDTIEIKDQDIFILATDGLYDNVDDDEIASVLRDSDTLEKKIDNLMSLALKLSKSKTHMTPFSKNAVKAGYRCSGGKEDDITVILSQYNEQSLSKL